MHVLAKHFTVHENEAIDARLNLRLCLSPNLGVSLLCPRNNLVLVPDGEDARVRNDSLRPLVKVGRLGGQVAREGLGQDAVLGRRVDANDKGTREHLGQRQLVGAAKERRRAGQQGLELLGGGGHQALDGLGAVRLGLAKVGLLQVAADLADKGVGEEGDAGAGQGPLGIRRGRDQVRREGVGQKVGDHGRLGDDLVAVCERRHQTPWVHLQVLGRARYREVNDLLLIGHAEFCQRNMGAVSPWKLSQSVSCTHYYSW